MLIKTKFSGYWPDGIRLYLGGGGGGAPPPDPRLVEAQIRSLGVQDDAVQRIMAVSERMQPLIEEQTRFGLDASKTAFEQAQADRAYGLERRDRLTGVQDQILKDAEDFNAGTRGSELAAQGVADVGMQAEASRQAQTRQMQRMNVNPSSGKMLAVQGGLGLSEAAAKAGIASKAREGARQEGYMLTGRANDALSGYPAFSAGTTGSVARYGVMGLDVANAGQQGMNSGNVAAVQGAGATGSNATSMYGAQANAYAQSQNQDDGLFGAIGTVAGAGIMAY